METNSEGQEKRQDLVNKSIGLFLNIKSLEAQLESKRVQLEQALGNMNEREFKNYQNGTYLQRRLEETAKRAREVTD